MQSLDLNTKSHKQLNDVESKRIQIPVSKLFLKNIFHNTNIYFLYLNIFNLD